MKFQWNFKSASHHNFKNNYTIIGITGDIAVWVFFVRRLDKSKKLSQQVVTISETHIGLGKNIFWREVHVDHILASQWLSAAECLALPNIWGGTMYPPPNRRSSITSWWKCFRWHIFLLFISTYLTHSGQISWLYHFNFWNYDRFLKGGAHKVMILRSKHCTSGKYLK